MIALVETSSFQESIPYPKTKRMQGWLCFEADIGVYIPKHSTVISGKESHKFVNTSGFLAKLGNWTS